MGGITELGGAPEIPGAGGGVLGQNWLQAAVFSPSFAHHRGKS